MHKAIKHTSIATKKGVMPQKTSSNNVDDSVSLTLADSEHLCSTGGTSSLNRRLAIPHGNGFGRA